MTKVVDLKRLNVPQLAQQNAHLQGTLPQEEFSRLRLGLELDASDADLTNMATKAGEPSGAGPAKSGLVHWSMEFFESELPSLVATPNHAIASPNVPPLSQLLTRELPSVVLNASARVDLVCQRCLGPLEETLDVQRQFYWVMNEDTAMALDEAMEEDVLVSSSAFDGQALIEDELIMSLPLVPMHETCLVALPQQLGLSTEEESLSIRPNPFAVLSGLKVKKS